jgi:hypothetical protein
MSEVSFLISTNKESRFPVFAGRTIESIEQANLPFSWDVLVCSKTEVIHPKVTWVKEPEFNRGAVLPYNLLHRNATGKYCALLSDDTSIDGTFPNAISFLQSDTYKNRKIKLTSLFFNKEVFPRDLVWIPNHKEPDFPNQIIRYPVYERQNFIENIGNSLQDGRFKHHFVDVYLTLYIYRVFGEAIPTCEHANVWLRSIEDCDKSNDKYDLDLYNYLVTLPPEMLTYE